MEAERLKILHDEQRKLRKRMNKEVRVKKAGAHLPGEERLHMDMAIFLKVGTPGISFTEIANRLGETKTTVKRWFKEDPYVKDKYDWVINNFRDGALELMKTYGLEAVETQALLMRFGSEKYMFEASREILDRIGAPKISRTEIEAEHVKSHKWTDREEMINEIRQLSPDKQEEAVEAIEKLEELLAAEAAKSEKIIIVDDEGEMHELDPIQNDEEEDEEDDE